ncbi:Short chain dehydrogenase yanD [Talaromyces pinophilus]|nr:Short chain dehydrogenase yanD [Talaromyces pinophilus]
MVGSKDLPPSTTRFASIFFHNQFRAKPQWPSPDTNLSGKTAIITGGNSGLGYESALLLLDLKLSHLVLAVRSQEKGQTAATKLRERFPKAKIEVWLLDMSSYNSIQTFARQVENLLPRIDYVLLNAGVRKVDFTIIESTSHEENLQVNYLSTMLLVVLLLPILKAKRVLGAAPAHLTIVNSMLSLGVTISNKNGISLFQSFDNPRNFSAVQQYNLTKLLAHMFLWNLVDYVSADDIIVNLADPAFVKGTDLLREVPGALRMGMRAWGAIAGRPPQVGASCLIDAMVSKGKESHGCFLMSWEIHPFAAMLYTPEGNVLRQRLWEETLTELDFAVVRTILESMRA